MHLNLWPDNMQFGGYNLYHVYHDIWQEKWVNVCVRVRACVCVKSLGTESAPVHKLKRKVRCTKEEVRGR